MSASSILLTVGVLLAGEPSAGVGVIRGVVVNGTREDRPCASAEVVLRAQLDGEFVPVARTHSDERGHFLFSDLEIIPGLIYLPGANLNDVHYPGPRVSLSEAQPQAAVGLRVHEAVTHPSPLIARRHEILITPQPGVLRVTETLTIDNPTLATFVGRPREGQQSAVTLTLSIPRDFDRATFHREFFGRNFAIADGKLITEIPWTPGRREVAFTYSLRNESAHRMWERPLDLPCAELRVRVKHTRPQEVACSLGDPARSQREEVVFESAGRRLPSGYVIRVELGRLPVSWVRYGRWIALGTLLGASLLAAFIARRAALRRASTIGPSAQSSPKVERRKGKAAHGRRRAA